MRGTARLTGLDARLTGPDARLTGLVPGPGSRIRLRARTFFHVQCLPDCGNHFPGVLVSKLHARLHFVKLEKSGILGERQMEPERLGRRAAFFQKAAHNGK